MRHTGRRGHACTPRHQLPREEPSRCARPGARHRTHAGRWCLAGGLDSATGSSERRTPCRDGAASTAPLDRGHQAAARTHVSWSLAYLAQGQASRSEPGGDEGGPVATVITSTASSGSPLTQGLSTSLGTCERPRPDRRGLTAETTVPLANCDTKALVGHVKPRQTRREGTNACWGSTGPARLGRGARSGSRRACRATRPRSLEDRQ